MSKDETEVKLGSLGSERRSRENSDPETTTQQSSRSPAPDAALERLKDGNPEIPVKRSIAAARRRRTERGTFDNSDP